MRASLLIGWISALTAISIGGLLACEESPRTTASRNVENPWMFAQSAMPLLVVVRGLPFPAPEVAVEDTVVDLTRGAVTWAASPGFTPVPAQAGSATLRLVYVFNGQPSSDPCAEDAFGGSWQQGGRITLIAALCDEAIVLARVDGLLKHQGGLDDPKFGKLIAQATRELLAPPSAPRP